MQFMRRGPIRPIRTKFSSARRALTRSPHRPNGEAGRDHRMMRALVLLHRWLGVAFCLLFAMWFASGAGMHFVPFPAPREASRFAGLAPLDLSGVVREPGEAASASGLTDVWRVKLMERTDGAVYLL